MKVMANLLYGTCKPRVMDIKIGQRTFQEDEVSNQKTRMDLLKKMMDVDPNEPTDEEKEKGITKLRYMRFREKQSSSRVFGFRIEAVSVPEEEGASLTLSHTKKYKSKGDIISGFARFLNGRRDAHEQLLTRLRLIRRELDASPWFHKHEMIGTSLLFVYDTSYSPRAGAGADADAAPKLQTGLWLIDLAHCIAHQDCHLTHRASWQAGNHEDGYLFGLDNLIRIWEEMGADGTFAEPASA